MQEIVFLGIFDKIANWVMSGISKVLTFLVSNVIVPIFSFLWDNILKYIVELLAEYFGALLYKIYALLLAILYGIERAIYAFAGAVDVKFGKEEGNILSMIFELPGVEEAFWYVNVLGITLCFIFTIYSVTKSTFDFNYDGKKSVGFILTQFFTSAITFLIIPLFCYGLISLTAICTRSLYIATSPAHSVSITDSLFMMTASSNLSAENCAKLQDILNSQPMAWFDWSNVSHVIGKTMNVDYIFGFIGAIVLLWNLIMISGIFIQRVLEVTILYITSPFFVATMPLDNGERFKKWRRTFIGRLCMGVSMIVALNVVMMVLSMLISGQNGDVISFTEPVSYTEDVIKYGNNIVINNILKLIFVVGSIISVKTLSNVITGIIDQDAANAESSAYGRPLEFAKDIIDRVGDIKNFSNKVQKFKEKMKKEQERDQHNKSAVRGFQGEDAKSTDIDFYDSLKKHGKDLKNTAAKEKMGMKAAAYSKAAEKTKQLRKEFRNAKTSKERDEIRKKFVAEGGYKNLSVDDKMFDLNKSEAPSEKANKALNNINKKIANQKRLRDNFDKGSDKWNSNNNKLEELKNAKNKLISKNSNMEREGVIDSNKDLYSDDVGFNKNESRMAELYRIKMNRAKTNRDKFEPNSEEWNKANKEYSDFANNYEKFMSTSNHADRQKMIDEYYESSQNNTTESDNNSNSSSVVSDSVPINQDSSKPQQAEFTSDDKKFIKNLEKVEKDSKNKYISTPFGKARVAHRQNVKLAQSMIDVYKNSDSDTRQLLREQFEANGGNDIFNVSNDTTRESLTPTESKLLLGFQQRKNNLIRNRDNFEKGSKDWNRCNEQIKRYDTLYASLEGMGTVQERESVMSNNLFSGDDSYYNELEGNYNYWTQMEKLATSPEEKNYAHSMATGYASFAERYISSDGNVLPMQDAEMSNLADFRTYNIPEEYVSAYEMASTHEERAHIYQEVKSVLDVRKEMAEAEPMAPPPEAPKAPPPPPPQQQPRPQQTQQVPPPQEPRPQQTQQVPPPQEPRPQQTQQVPPPQESRPQQTQQVPPPQDQSRPQQTQQVPPPQEPRPQQPNGQGIQNNSQDNNITN